jgi:hypothetical protein
VEVITANDAAVESGSPVLFQEFLGQAICHLQMATHYAARPCAELSRRRRLGGSDIGLGNGALDLRRRPAANPLTWRRSEGWHRWCCPAEPKPLRRNRGADP